MGNNFNLAEAFIAVSIGVLSTVFFLVCCEFGAMLSNKFDTLNDELFQCKWYLFPIEVQKMLIVFMAGTQEVV